jgi:hypothetical protein
MNNKKTIILLYAQHEPNIEALQESLLSCCEDNDLTIIKTIIADNDYDCQVLTGLINLISSQNSPINLILTHNSLNELFHIFTYTVIATLLEAKMINSLYIYQGKTSQDATVQGDSKIFATKGEGWLEIKNNLLPFCAEYYKAMILLKKTKTFYDDE